MKKIIDGKLYNTDNTMSNAFETKKKIVLKGGSQIFKNWSEHSTITIDEFLENLEWVCSDPLDETGHMTREIGLTPTGIVKLRRVYDSRSGLVTFYLDGKLWCGARFETATPEAEKPRYGDTIEEWHKISLSCSDRV